MEYQLGTALNVTMNNMKKEEYLHIILVRDLLFIVYKDYEERTRDTCLTNQIEGIGEVIDLSTGDTDPHGIVEVLKVFKITEEQKVEIDHWFSCCNVYSGKNIHFFIEKIEGLIKDNE